jgi:hypothetical protein
VEFLRLQADDYESALRLARQKWGSAVRVHTRRDIPAGRGAVRCEITFYLVDLAKQKRFEAAAHRDSLLEANGIPKSRIAERVTWQEIEAMQQAEVEVHLIEALFASIDYSRGLDRRYQLLLGDEAKALAPGLAVCHRGQEGKKVAILLLGGEDLAFSEAVARHALPLYSAANLQEAHALFAPLEAYDRVVVIADDEGLLAPIDDQDLTRILVTGVVPVAMSGIDALLVTGLEEAATVGPLLAYLLESSVAFLYIVDGMGDVRLADSSVLLTRLRGFTLDLEALSFV